MASTGLIDGDQTQMPEDDQQDSLSEEQTVEEQVAQAAGPAPANRRRRGNRRRRQNGPRRVLHLSGFLFAWNRVYYHERRPRAEPRQQRGTGIWVYVIQMYAAMTYDDYEKMVIVAFLLGLSVIRPNALLVIVAGLISPLIGPVISAIIGSVNDDRQFSWLGLKNSLIGIAISALVGFTIGLILYGFGHLFSMTASIAEDILYQCNFLSIFMRMQLAILTGAACVLFVLNRGFLYSVRWAISTSLLLPAVRAGMQLGLGLATQLLQAGQHMCKPRFDSYKCQYSKHLETEMLVSGLASVLQVAVNLFWITLIGTFVLRWTVCHSRIPVLQNPH